ncbi:hypothetical protein [Methanimicrococcus blatticola]|uniref:Uncharacterized protein n=1 Tax=Methanimicrococcus blatticola TaxID=91560 RepID=A0A484F566_9EURY|nr:hypothetical protein [Methanimicrococcus blatticola]MBZ3935676.1 hypothetical protein [Methanimicrococcus blatticola]MCC2508203.1 hypothetical protein [Methanimicrococcus blatticola]TDQ68719.1 hypothetical protein C7391_0910 [Methanimicrococcus blatticola]
MYSEPFNAMFQIKGYVKLSSEELKELETINELAEKDWEERMKRAKAGLPF